MKSQRSQTVRVKEELTTADPIEFQILTLDEALDTVKRDGRGFKIFCDRKTQRANVLFKREDGTIGIIEA